MDEIPADQFVQLIENQTNLARILGKRQPTRQVQMEESKQSLTQNPVNVMTSQPDQLESREIIEFTEFGRHLDDETVKFSKF